MFVNIPIRVIKKNQNYKFKDMFVNIPVRVLKKKSEL